MFEMILITIFNRLLSLEQVQVRRNQKLRIQIIHIIDGIEYMKLINLK